MTEVPGKKLTGQEKPENKVSAEFEEPLRQVLEGLPPEKAKELQIFLTQISSSHYRGPIPPASELIAYNQAIPNGAERILSMAEKQSTHRMELEKTAVDRQTTQNGRGQIFGLVMGLVGIGSAVWLAMNGHDTVAGIFGTTTIGGLVYVFVIGKKAQKENLKEKS